MTRSLKKLVPLAMICLSSLLGASARAAIPADYKGLPFDPAVAGGPKLPAGVKAGPYTIPGRLDFINYDMGGDGVGYHAGDHITKGGAGYRVDGQTATLSWTGQCIPNVGNAPCMNVWYDTSATLDGTKYPSATSEDFSIGAVQNGDWFNLTVNVTTARARCSLSSTWASGRRPARRRGRQRQHGSGRVLQQRDARDVVGALSQLQHVRRFPPLEVVPELHDRAARRGARRSSSCSRRRSTSRWPTYSSIS